MPLNSPRCCPSLVSGWPATPAASVHRWESSSAAPAYGIEHLRDNIDRFIFLLGGSGGDGDHDEHGEGTP